MLKTYDSSQAAFIERDNNKYYNATQEAWTDVPSIKSYDTTQSAWEERLCKFFELVGSDTSGGSSYSIIESGNGVSCSIYGDSDDYITFSISGLSIPDGSTLKFTYTHDYWQCTTILTVRADGVQLCSEPLSAGEFERVFNYGRTITEIRFTFATPDSPVTIMTGATLKNVQFGNLKFKFS